jgi:fumarylacetoacetase
MSPDATNDPQRKSWVPAANRADSDFPIQNLPIAVCRPRGGDSAFRGGVAIGDQILDLARAAAIRPFEGVAAAALEAASRPALNELMQLGFRSWTALRRALSDGLLEGSALESGLRGCLFPQSEAEFALPAQIGDFTDFYSSIHHATTVGRLFRPDNPLMPNYKWMPIGYHGRSSSISVSGLDFHRPRGQRLPPGQTQPIVGPSARLDYELELGVFLGDGNVRGDSIPIAEAESHVFGLCLLNDWSARDLQAWEYQPLGPFLAKNFATTVSPWIVSLQALAPFRVPHTRDCGDPQPPDYLSSASNDASGGFDIHLEVWLETASMRAGAEPPQRLSTTSFKHSY